MLPDTEGKYHGVYVGTVVFNEDPDFLGRVQVRIDEVYGESDVSVSRDDNLPWANICSFLGGFNDGGSHTPYPVGATVLVVFEQGNKDRPWVLGGCVKKPIPTWEYGTPETSMGRWKPSPGSISDVPVEVQEDREETKYVIFKTPKGAALVVEERDEEESIRLLGRGGQVIEIAAPVTEAQNEENDERRGARNSLDANQVSYGSMAGAATLQAMDLAGQYIKLTALQNGERVEIRGCKRHNVEPQTIEISNVPGNEEIKLTDKAGQTVTLHGGTSPYVRLQSGGSFILLDQGSGNITIDATGTVTIRGTAVTINP